MSNLRHGLSDSREYKTWSSMQRRCHCEKASDYRSYGARGIRVADEWRGPGGFERFYAHMGPKPSPRHQIDRIDGTRGYEPGNVRWVTPEVNQANKVRRPVSAKKRARRHRRMAAWSAVNTWERRRSLYSAAAMSAICADVSSQLRSRFGEPRSLIVSPGELSMESFYCEGDYSSGNFHTDDIDATGMLGTIKSHHDTSYVFVAPLPAEAA